MKTPLILASLLILTGILARAEDWKTTDGQAYKDVKALSHDDGYVTIMYADGGARIQLSKLPPDLQNRFNYDPAKAAAKVAATVAEEKRERAARIAEEANAPSPIAATQSPSISPPPPRVVSTQAAPPRSTGTQTSQVDVLANNMEIEEDQTKLDSLDQDLQIAMRDAAREDSWGHRGDMHFDNTGTLHPNCVGISADERVAEIQKQKLAVQAEIDRLKKENASAAQAAK